MMQLLILNKPLVLIIIGMLTAFAARMLPFVLKNNMSLSNNNGKFYKFLSYSTQGMLGIIVYDTMFRQVDIIKLIYSFNLINLAGIITLIFIFIFVAKTNRMFLGLFLSLLAYFIFVFTYIK